MSERAGLRILRNQSRRVGDYLRDWGAAIETRGWRKGTSKVWADVKPFLTVSSTPMVVMARSLLEPIPHPQARLPIDIHRFDEKHLSLVETILDHPSDRRLLARRLERGHLGFLAFHQARPVGFAWGCTRVDSTIDRVPFPLQDGDVLFLHTFTAPKYRRQGIMTALMARRMQTFQEMGYRRALIHIRHDNRGSRAVCEKLGCAQIGSIQSWRIGPWRWARCRLGVHG